MNIQIILDEIDAQLTVMHAALEEERAGEAHHKGKGFLVDSTIHTARIGVLTNAIAALNAVRAVTVAQAGG